ncbi:unnamed protein product [Rotaria magnacalcarata]|uniref:Glycine amidinotransferase n=1 Tax=Rotaria magnacalcarata TaxID=392030 RepID=A0A816M122_9BILA|nr:unnamed protein product [Rotaria magnacalcarata]
MASSSIVNSWTEWGALELICVGTAEGMCYPDDTPSYPWHRGDSKLHPYVRSISGLRPRRRIQEAQAQLDNLTDLLRAESIAVINSIDEVFDEDIGKSLPRKQTIITDNIEKADNHEIFQKKKIDVVQPLNSSEESFRFNHQIATPHFKSQYQFGLACPRDILITFGDTVIEAPTSIHTRYFESEYYKPLLYSLWRRDSNMKWLQPPKPTCSLSKMFHDADYWEKVDTKDYNQSIFVNSGYKTNLNENEIAFDAADIMRMGKDVFYKKAASANNQGFNWLRRTFPHLRFHMMHFPNDGSYHLDVSLVPLRPPTAGSHGLILLNQNYPPLASEMKIFIDNDWHPIWAPLPSTSDVSPLALCTANLNTNLLSLNDHCVIIEECETSLYRMLHDELGFDVITCPLRRLNEFGGGLHCGRRLKENQNLRYRKRIYEKSNVQGGANTGIDLLNQNMDVDRSSIHDDNLQENNMAMEEDSFEPDVDDDVECLDLDDHENSNEETRLIDDVQSYDKHESSESSKSDDSFPMNGGNIYKANNNGEPCLNLMMSTDGKPIVKAKNQQTSVWLVISFLADIPPPAREYLNNILLHGLWHSPVTPPCHILLNKIVENIKCLIDTGINIIVNNEILHFSIKIQLFAGDLPARAKVNRMINHNGYYTCSMCLFEGRRCSRPCGRHTLYRWFDYVKVPQRRRTQEQINNCSKLVNVNNKNILGVLGFTPLSYVLSIPKQSTFDYFHLVYELQFRYLLSEWHCMLKNNLKALQLIDQYLEDVHYPHTFNRKPSSFATFGKWKASELRCFMNYVVLPLLVKLSLDLPNSIPEVMISHFVILFIYIRTLRCFDNPDDIQAMARYIHVYLSYFAELYNPCKELFSVHALVHLWQQVAQHGSLAYNSLFASESCLHFFEKLAHGSVVLGCQMAYWWCIVRQISSKQTKYSIDLFTECKIIRDDFIDIGMVRIYEQEFDLIFYGTFNEFPCEPFKYYSRFKNGMILYHSLSYIRRGKSNSYTVRIENRRDSTQSIFYYGQLLFFFERENESFVFYKRSNKKITVDTSNSQSLFAHDIDDFDQEETEFDENFPILRDVSFYSQPHRNSTVQRTTAGNFYTPPTKRKLPQNNSLPSSDALTEQMNSLQVMLKEINRKMDVVNRRDDLFEKKLECVDKRIGGLLRQLNKNPTPNAIPNELPTIVSFTSFYSSLTLVLQLFDNRNLLSGPVGPTPAFLIKRLVNELFSKKEIMEGEHEQANERTEKIKNAVQVCFFQDDRGKLDGFWESSTNNEPLTDVIAMHKREPITAFTVIEW